MHLKNLTIKKLIEKYKEISLLGKVKAVLDWDLNVNLPQKGSEGRARQSAYITELVVNKWLDPEFRKILDQANNESNLLLEEKAILRNINYSGKYYLKVPKEIIIEKEKTASEAFMSWQEAKKQDKFVDFLPYLSKIIELSRIVADHLGYKDNPYDALLDLFEPELTAKFTEEKFSKIKPALTKLLIKIRKSKKYQSPLNFVNGQLNYPIESQKQLSLFVAKKSGYDLNAGRIDVSAHPFTTALDRFDVRITTMYKALDLRSSFTSTMHETGHAIYEQGINEDYSETPLEFGVSMGIHEAMSRFWENQVGRNPNFLKFLRPVFQAFYPEQLGQVGDETLVKLFNWVEPGFIRIEADEVTYSLHIILRFEIEKALINKKLKPKDLPEVWRAKMKQLFAITPKTDREGVLQDVHWSYGAFGYFPSYALGNLYAAQLLAKMKQELDVENLLLQGNLDTIRFWLKDNIYQYGSLYLPLELIKKATNEELNPKYFIDYINKKYTQIFGGYFKETSFKN